MNIFDSIDRLMFETPDTGSGGGAGGEADITDVISESLEGVDRGDDQEDAEPEVVEPSADDAAKKAEAEKEEAELKALEADILAKNPQMRGQIAVHRHQAVLTRTRNQLKAEVEAKEQALKQLQWAQDPEIKQALAAIALAETDQKAFVELLMQDPRYANLIAFKEAQQQQQQQTDPNAGRPGPNKLSEDGTTKYYDEEGLAALMAWERKKAVEEAKAEIAKEFGPVKEKYEQDNLWNQSLETQRKVLEGARTNWKGFKENEPAIKQALIANPTWDLNDAYRSVVIEKFAGETKVNREAMRKELLAELNGKKPAAQSLKPGAGVEREANDNPNDIEDVIRRSIARAQA